MSQNIKYAKYTVELNKIGYKHTFGDLEVLSLLEFVKKQVYVFEKQILEWKTIAGLVNQNRQMRDSLNLLGININARK